MNENKKLNISDLIVDFKSIGVEKNEYIKLYADEVKSQYPSVECEKAFNSFLLSLFLKKELKYCKLKPKRKIKKKIIIKTSFKQLVLKKK